MLINFTGPRAKMTREANDPFNGYPIFIYFGQIKQIEIGFDRYESFWEKEVGS